MKFSAAVLLFLSFCSIAIAQPTIQPVPYSPFEKVSVGLGLGMDMGGIGVNLLGYPIHQVGVFGGLGHAIAGVGVNAGLKLRMTSSKKSPSVSPYLIGMYGYNAAVYVENSRELNKTFNGVTAGLGLDIRPRPAKRTFLSIALLVPFRDDPAIDTYLEDNYIQLSRDFFPMSLSVALRIDLRK